MYIGFTPPVYRVEDVERLRERVQVGDVLWTEVQFNRLGERLIVPKKVRVKVMAKYPHLVRVTRPDGRELPMKTITYKDLLLEKAEKKGEGVHVR